MMDVTQALLGIPLIKSSNPASAAAILPFARLRSFDKGQHLFLDKDKVEHIYFLVSGTAALYKLSDNHERRVIFICAAGELLNEVILDGRDASINCEILAPSLVICIEKRRFISACEQDFALSSGVMDSMSLKIRRLYRQIKNTTGNTRSDRRIAAKLWKLSRDHGVPCPEGVMINFDMTVTFLAEFLGLTRETVSRQVKALCDKGLIIVSNSRFIITDEEKLREYY